MPRNKRVKENTGGDRTFGSRLTQTNIDDPLPYVPMPHPPVEVDVASVAARLDGVLRETYLAQRAAIIQQQEMTRYIHGLNTWLEQDRRERQGELRRLREKIEEFGSLVLDRSMDSGHPQPESEQDATSPARSIESDSSDESDDGHPQEQSRFQANFPPPPPGFQKFPQTPYYNEPPVTVAPVIISTPLASPYSDTGQSFVPSEYSVLKPYPRTPHER